MNKGKLLAYFSLGIILGYKALPLVMHVAYLTIILILLGVIFI